MGLQIKSQFIEEIHMLATDDSNVDAHYSIPVIGSGGFMSAYEPSRY